MPPGAAAQRTGIDHYDRISSGEAIELIRAGNVGNPPLGILTDLPEAPTVTFEVGDGPEDRPTEK